MIEARSKRGNVGLGILVPGRNAGRLGKTKPASLRLQPLGGLVH